MLKRLLTVFLLYCLFYRPVFAQSEFSTNYTVDYTITPDGLTKAKLDISLINSLSNIYAKEFTLSIGSTQLSDIRVTNASGFLTPQIVQGNKTTNIAISFPQKVLGKDKAQNFTLEFTSADFSHSLGHIWEISIPRLTKNDNLRNYDLTLTVPNSFGPPSTITPSPTSVQNIKTNTVYRFNPEELLTKGISATFGSTQYFDFHLQYHLQNPNLFPVKTEIALPPDTAYQTLVYQTLEPKPENITVDPDGNWLAAYLLSSQQNLTVTATGSAEISLQPSKAWLGTKNEAVNYLTKQKYWETDNPKIIKLADGLKLPANIYQYVVDNLIYDYGRIAEGTTRFGAANALDNPTSAICTEFTDLFIALARSAGIPSRAINGFAYTTNSGLRPLSLKLDILHAWPEYFDSAKNLWIPIDPTWGNTTGGVDFFNHTDLNHFTFVILGKDSQYPIPAGAYKTPDTQKQDVQVEFGSPLVHSPQIAVQFNLPQIALAGINLRGSLTVHNSGNVALYNQIINLAADGLKLTQSAWEIPVLLPFTSQTFSFDISAAAWNDHSTHQLTARTDYSIQTHNLAFKPLYSLIFTQTNLIYFCLGLVIIISLVFMIKKFYNKKR